MTGVDHGLLIQDGLFYTIVEKFDHLGADFAYYKIENRFELNDVFFEPESYFTFVLAGEFRKRIIPIV